MEGEIKEKRENWITKILEYDIKVKPTKVVCVRGLCEYLVQELTPEEEMERSKQVLINQIEPKCWIQDRINFMQTKRYFPSLPLHKTRFYKL